MASLMSSETLPEGRASEDLVRASHDPARLPWLRRAVPSVPTPRAPQRRSVMAAPETAVRRTLALLAGGDVEVVVRLAHGVGLNEKQLADRVANRHLRVPHDRPLRQWAEVRADQDAWQVNATLAEGSTGGVAVTLQVTPTPHGWSVGVLALA